MSIAERQTGDDMEKKNPTYLLVDAEVLPDIFQKVVSAKELLSTGACSTVQQAATATGISRSAFYKYKEYVFPFYEMGKDRILTLFLELVDTPGILSDILNVFAKAGLNVLTINQNIPINGTANITVSLRTGEMEQGIADVIETIEKMDMVRRIKLLARE
jgi:chorismate mutase